MMLWKNKFRNLTIQNLEKLLPTFSSSFKKDSYISSYSFFLDFTEKKELDITSYVVLTNMAYGWMPRVLNLNLTEKDKIQSVLDKLNNRVQLNISDFEVLKKSINNSVVGMSKFLHFVDPFSYPILDSHVFKYITGRKYATGIDQPAAYIAYKEMLDEIISQKDAYAKIYRIVCEVIEDKVSAYRCLEMIMFYSRH